MGALATSCLSVPAQDPAWPIREPEAWERGQVAYQGLVGFATYQRMDLVDGAPPAVGEEVDVETLPLLGGAFQVGLFGRAVDVGLDLGFDFGIRSDGDYSARSGSGGAVVVVDVDVSLFDAYGGFFASAFPLSDVRVYAAGGSFWQGVHWEQSDPSGEDDVSGSGVGPYARAGIEWLLPNGSWIGVGARWIDVEVHLGGGLGELGVDGVQLFLTVTQGI